MRNLKKILALALALMMVISMMVTANAAIFTDDADISYVESVEVLVNLGILSGDDKGAFNPNGTLNRAGAAKLVAFVALGGDIDFIEKVETSFSDVDETHWASGFIAYCAQEGYINGYNGKFNPDGLINGYGFAKLMLEVMGIEGNYTGDEWTLAVAANAKAVGLTSGLVDFKLSNNITREEAAQMARNALVYEYVETGKFVINATETYVNADGDEVANEKLDLIVAYTEGKVFDSMVDAAVYMNVMAGNSIIAGTHYTIDEYSAPALIETNFGTVFTHYTEETGRDPYGRPSNVYDYGVLSGLGYRNADYTEYYSVTPDVVYTAPTTKYQVLTDLGVVEVTTSAKPVYANYYEDGLVVDKNDGATKELTLSKYIEPYNAQTIGNYGSTTEVYNLGTARSPKLTVVEVHTYLAQVTGIQTYRPATATLPVRYPFVFVDILGATVSSGALLTFDASSYAEDEWVLVNLCKGAVTDMKKATVITGTVNKYNSSSVTVDGTVYNQSLKAKAYYSTISDEFLSANYYLVDENNVVYGYTEINTATNYVYVVKYESTTGTTGLLTNATEPAVKAAVIFTDGTYAVIDLALSVDSDDNLVYDQPQNNATITEDAALENKTGDDAVNVGAWFAYSVMEDGSYTLKAIDSTKVAAEVGQSISMTEKESETDMGVLLSTSVVTGLQLTNTVVSTTGFVGLPTVTDTYGDVDANTNYDVLVTYVPKTNIITNVYVVGEPVSATSSSTYAYIYKHGDIIYNGVHGYVQEIEMLIDGKLETVNFRYTGTAFDDAPGVGYVYALKADTAIKGCYVVDTDYTAKIVNDGNNAIDNSAAAGATLYRVLLVDKTFVALQAGTYTNGKWTDSAVAPVINYFGVNGVKTFNVAFEWDHNGEADSLEADDIVVVAVGPASDLDLVYIVGDAKK